MFAPLTLVMTELLVTVTLPRRTKQPQAELNPPVALKVPPLSTRLVKVVAVPEESTTPPELTITGVNGFVALVTWPPSWL